MQNHLFILRVLRLSPILRRIPFRCAPFLVCVLTACVSKPPPAEHPGRLPEAEGQEEKIPSELSLQEDRSQLDELRKDIPADARQGNDELAFLIRDMGQQDNEPSQIRDNFNRVLRKRREKLDQQLRKEREVFNQTERKKRDTFLADVQKERETYLRQKRDQKQRNDFFNGQEGKRRDFFATQTEHVVSLSPISPNEEKISKTTRANNRTNSIKNFEPTLSPARSVVAKSPSKSE